MMGCHESCCLWMYKPFNDAGGKDLNIQHTMVTYYPNYIKEKVQKINLILYNLEDKPVIVGPRALIAMVIYLLNYICENVQKRHHLLLLNIGFRIFRSFAKLSRKWLKSLDFAKGFFCERSGWSTYHLPHKPTMNLKV